MKTLIVALALVGALASQASAQEAQPDQTKTARQHRVVVHPTTQRHAPNASTDVYAPSGQYVGSDPDRFIRNSMWFDSALEGND